MRTIRFVILSLAVLFVLGLTGCMTNRHIIGNGASGGVEETETQWYALWGLVPLNDVETQEMVGTATDYEIVTEISPLDAVINFFTTYVSIIRRSVTVIQ